MFFHALAVISVLLPGSRPAQACRAPSAGPTRIVSELITEPVESSPPASIQSAWIEDLFRDDTNDTRGDACASKAGCVLVGTIVVGLDVPADDATPSDEIGYLVSVESRAGGRVPSLFAFAEVVPGQEVVRIAEDGKLFVDFVEPEDEVVALDFDLVIVPVDLAGNTGESFRLRVRDSDAMGCQAGGFRGSGLLPVWIMATVLIVRKRRRPESPNTRPGSSIP